MILPFYSFLVLLVFPIHGRRSTRSGEVTRIFGEMFKYVILYWVAGWQPSKAMVVCVGIFALSTNGFSSSCSNLGALQGKSALDLDEAVRTTSQKLIQARAAANGLHPY